MSKRTYGAKPKPPPALCVERGIARAEHWHDLARAIVEELEPHLRTRTENARAAARESVEQVVMPFISMCGCCSTSNTGDAAAAVMALLTETTLLSDRALKRLPAPTP